LLLLDVIFKQFDNNLHKLSIYMQVGQPKTMELLCSEALGLILSPDECSGAVFEVVEGSVNNIIRYVKIGDSMRYVIRVYNNGNDTAKVKFEHMVLSQLRLRHLSFQIPTAIKSKTTNDYIVILSNGASASIFEVIPGSLPKLQFTREVGRACGELAIALGDLTQVMTTDMMSQCCNPPYYDLYKVHDAITRELFYQQVQLPEYNCSRESINFLVESIRVLENELSSYHDLALPTQLIHGDLHYDNILCSSTNHDGESCAGRVTGVLDFEFCAMDWRPMELAICLSKYISESDPLPYLVDFISGMQLHTKIRGPQHFRGQSALHFLH
jgi:homoserine kinase type II